MAAPPRADVSWAAQSATAREWCTSRAIRAGTRAARGRARIPPTMRVRTLVFVALCSTACRPGGEPDGGRADGGVGRDVTVDDVPALPLPSAACAPAAGGGSAATQ